MDCRPLGSPVHRIFQARILEWVAISFSKGSSWLRDWNLKTILSKENANTKVLKWVWTWLVQRNKRLVWMGGEKAMAPHSSALAWKIPWTVGPGRLQSMGSLRVGHYWVTLLSLFTFMHWRRKWHPTPVFLPGESQRWRSLVGCRLWGRTESDTTEAT